MTPLDYAQLCARRYPPLGFNTLKIKGRGHVPRTEIDRHNKFQRLLSQHKVTEREEDYGDYHTHWYTSTSLFNIFSDDLAAAGIDVFSGLVVSEDHWSAAQAIVRLTGQPYDHDATLKLAAQVRDLVEQQADAALSRAFLNGEL